MKYKLLSHLNTVLFSNLLKNNRKVVLLINKVDATTLKENKHE
jgi:predicted GTPase